MRKSLRRGLPIGKIIQLFSRLCGKKMDMPLRKCAVSQVRKLKTQPFRWLVYQTLPSLKKFWPTQI